MAPDNVLETSMQMWQHMAMQGGWNRFHVGVSHYLYDHFDFCGVVGWTS